jgi:lipopolysaccharide/colanic/teichoic acid biosynthesis glycosyltransferase
VKRIFDVLAALIAGTIVAPIALIVALAIWLERHGPVVISTDRVGQFGKIFKHYRFRTMAGYPLRKTRLGRLIGNLSLDDLPTLWNILIGDLSIVGPRPETPDKVDLTDLQWQKILTVKPGLTGMAILSLRGNYNATSIQERIIPELEYVERQSIWLDMQLILRTIYWWLRMGHVKGSF